MKKLLTTLFLGLFLLPLIAQESDKINATATIAGEFSVIGEDNLVFGEVPFGVPTTINTNDVGRGMFIIEQGPGNPNILMSFDFPTHLEYKGPGTGSSDLPIDNWKYAKGAETTTTESGTSITSGAVVTANIAQEGTIVGGKRTLYVFVGATVTPNIDTWAGEYENELTLTVEYN